MIFADVPRRPRPVASALARPARATSPSGTRAVAGSPPAAHRADRRAVARRAPGRARRGPHAVPQAPAGAARPSAGPDVGRTADVDALVSDGGDVRRAARHPRLPL